METIETQDWKLSVFLQWVPKKLLVECPICGGKGETGGGFKDLDDAKVCYKCNGSGKVKSFPSGQEPEIPPKLREHMRRAWVDYTQDHCKIEK